MQIKGEQLAGHLQRELQPVYLVHGDEPLLVIEAADAIRAAAKQRGFDERDVLTAMTGFNWNDLYHAAGSLSLFGGRKVIDLRIPGGKPGRDGSAALQDYCARPSPDSLLLVTVNGLDWKEEKAAWVSALAAAGVVVKPMPPTIAELPAWLAGRLRRQRQSADAEGLRFIADRVEGNLLAAHQEILKLGVLFPQGALHLDQIRDAVLNVARYNLDGLREALLAGDVARLARTLDGLRQEGEAPLLVLWAMTEEVRALAEISAGLENRQPLEMLLKSARVWGTRQLLIKRALKRVTRQRATSALATAARIDRMIKGLDTGDVWNEFRRLGLSIAA
ncbi:MAG TPA: DNA polymerase III subunit delta [Accumulibacter sp.]|jgi:DNA polymerase-3 subunit delta|nr:DNA polymerase III subunit delta [Accumulibacter sp.]HQC80236.1 DNA polymerase III subunit delta [Accumulibacter sp.]